MTLAARRVPSAYPHPLYEVEFLPTGVYGEEAQKHIPRGTSTAPQAGATIVVSQIDGTDDHTPMLDIDIPAFLIPSSTPGHSHLYIEKKLTWKEYKKLLKALMKAGIIEVGYYKVSVKRKHTALRLRGVKKVGV